jgi:hypothetical protein
MRRLLMLFAIGALCLPAFAFAFGSPHGKTIVGTLSGTTSASVTVTSSTGSLTCSVPDHAAATIAKIPLGGHFRLTCRGDGTKLVLVKLERADTRPTTAPPTTGGVHNGNGGTTTTTTTTTPTTVTTPTNTTTPPSGGGHDGDHGPGSTTTTAKPPTPPPTQPPPPAPPTPPSNRDGRGVVTSLSSTSVLLTPDGGGAPFACAITPAPDSTAAAAKLSVGAHVGIVCRLDGTRYVLSGVTPIT